MLRQEKRLCGVGHNGLNTENGVLLSRPRVALSDKVCGKLRIRELIKDSLWPWGRDAPISYHWND